MATAANLSMNTSGATAALTKSKPMTGTAEQFDEELFETRLEALKDTQEGIQQMSSWCLQHRTHYKKIIQCWLNVFKRVRVEHRLVLFYLANDVIQYSKRKRYEFVECWATALQRATTMVRDERVKGKILRIFHIWEQREIYSEEFLSDLSGLLNINPPKKSQSSADPSDDFNSGILAANIRECVELGEATDKSFKKLPKTPVFDIEIVKQQLKDKSHSGDIEKEIERYIAYINAFNKNIQNELKCRKTVIENLESAIKFYANQRGEVKVVATAYKNFGSRIKLVKKKLDDLSTTLPSPIPSPDINAPSPERDADLQLPDEQSPISINNLFKNSNINGYTSYMDGKLPFDINDFKAETNSTSAKPIEVIGGRSDDGTYSASGYYKPEPLSAYNAQGSSNSSGGNGIPALTSLPGQSGYSSLARNAQQYNSMIPPPAPHYGSAGSIVSNHSNEYTPHMPNYNANESYSPSAVSSAPPPPLPPVGISSGSQSNVNAGSTTDEFNSTWNMNMSWTSMESSTSNTTPYTQQSTPHSPPHFECKAHSSTAPIEYTEHHSDMMGTQDVDHRQLQLPPAFNFGGKLPLSKDKTRQIAVDIDHRNLISLTGSPGGEKDFPTNNSGDVDYRHPVATTVTKRDAEDATASGSSPLQQLMAPPHSNYAKRHTSPQKSNASSSSESAKEDVVGNAARYDPMDMVVDMDLSDEDLDEVLREAAECQSEEDLNSVQDPISGELSQLTDDTNLGGGGVRPALLETPTDFMQANIWDGGNGNGMSPPPPPTAAYMGAMEMELERGAGAPQPPHPAWNNMPWNGGNGGIAPPPPPRPPYPMGFQQFPSGARGGGRSRGWTHQFRPGYPRPQRGGGAVGVGGNFDGSPRAVPYFNRGGGRGLRGKFRGGCANNAWN